MAQRDPFRSSQVESRRNRPAKPPLSRDVIVDEALRQLTAGESMSLRRIATALDTGPASLYVYVDDLTELQALVLDRALGAVEVGAAGDPWRPRVEGLLRSYVGVMSATPELARLGFQVIAVGPNAMRITEALLEILDAAGVEQKAAAWAVNLLTTFATAVAVEHHPSRATLEGPVSQAVDRAPESEFPRIHAARHDMISGTGEERFAWSIEVLLRGILHDSCKNKGSAGE